MKRWLQYWDSALFLGGLLAIGVVIVVNAGDILNPPPPPTLTHSVLSSKDNQPHWQIDCDQPYEIRLRHGPCLGNWGSEFTIAQDGEVVLR